LLNELPSVIDLPVSGFRDVDLFSMLPDETLSSILDISCFQFRDAEEGPIRIYACRLFALTPISEMVDGAADKIALWSRSYLVGIK
jgi:hypothetical protein